MGDEISFNLNSILNSFNQTKKFLSQKRVLYSIYIFLLSAIVFITSKMRLQNLSLLKDSTTGEYIPTALDPFYFLRIARTIIEQGSLPLIDSMRSPSANIPFTQEILGQVVVSMYKIANIFGDYSLGFIDVISPVIFFTISLVAFFFLIYKLTDSKATALISTVFLSIIPTYLYRTAAGFSDHESLGMMAFFLAMLVYIIGIKYLEKKESLLKISLLGILTGFLTTFTAGGWGGIANFIFMIFPLSFFILWVLETKNNKNASITKYLIFYASWLLSSIFISPIFGYEIIIMIKRFTLSASGLISLFVLGFLFFEYFFIKLIKKENTFLKEREKYRILFSIFSVFLFGAIFLLLSGTNLFQKSIFF